MIVVEGMELTIVRQTIDKPYTLIEVEHVSDGVTYLAHGFACWRKPDLYNWQEGSRMALLRAKRKIAKRLKGEAATPDSIQRLKNEVFAAEVRFKIALSRTRDIAKLHRDGGTVQL